MSGFRNWIAAVAAAVVLQGAADCITGKVTRVSDGDTIWVMDAVKLKYKVRLDRIDAPEKNQPWGKESASLLKSWIFGKDVRVEYAKRDRYGRILGVVYEGTNDVNLAMVRTPKGTPQLFDNSGRLPAKVGEVLAECGRRSAPMHLAKSSRALGEVHPCTRRSAPVRFDGVHPCTFPSAPVRSRPAIGGIETRCRMEYKFQSV